MPVLTRGSFALHALYGFAVGLLLASSGSATPSDLPARSLWQRRILLAEDAALDGNNGDSTGDGKVLRNFQVTTPPNVDYGARTCSMLLIDHVFGNSYGQPAIARYTPPSAATCGVDVGGWASIVMNLTVTSQGTQYDRLSSIYLSNVEIWRTSTAEPTRNGIVWTYLKDVTRYYPLFTKPGPLLMDLGNTLDPKVNLTGSFHVQLSVTFFAPTKTHPKPEAVADVILPVTTLSETQANYFAVPPSGVRDGVVFPDNALEAYAEIYASGNGQEEFWYTNLVDNLLPRFDPDLGLLGKGPFREVELYIDGRLVGAVFPFPVIFTGGIINLIWRPIAAYGAFDQPTYTIDLTPFLPLLTDSRPHNFTLAVSGQGTSPPRSINNNWFVSGSIAIKLAPGPGRTTGKLTKYDVGGGQGKQHNVTPATKTTTKKGSGGKVIEQLVRAHRRVEVESEVEWDDGKGGRAKGRRKWESHWGFGNLQVYENGGDVSTVNQTITGHSISYHDGHPVLVDDAHFPLSVYTSVTNSTESEGPRISGSIRNTYRRDLSLPLAGLSLSHQTTSRSRSRPPPTSHTSTTQIGSGYIQLNSMGRVSGGSASLRQFYAYADDEENTYSRRVQARDGKVVKDQERGGLAPDPATQDSVDEWVSEQGWGERDPEGEGGQIVMGGRERLVEHEWEGEEDDDEEQVKGGLGIEGMPARWNRAAFRAGEDEEK